MFDILPRCNYWLINGLGIKKAVSLQPTKSLCKSMINLYATKSFYIREIKLVLSI